MLGDGEKHIDSNILIDGDQVLFFYLTIQSSKYSSIKRVPMDRRRSASSSNLSNKESNKNKLNKKVFTRSIDHREIENKVKNSFIINIGALYSKVQRRY